MSSKRNLVGLSAVNSILMLKAARLRKLSNPLRGGNTVSGVNESIDALAELVERVAGIVRQTEESLAELECDQREQAASVVSSHRYILFENSRIKIRSMVASPSEHLEKVALSRIQTARDWRNDLIGVQSKVLAVLRRDHARTRDNRARQLTQIKTLTGMMLERPGDVGDLAEPHDEVRSILDATAQHIDYMGHSMDLLRDVETRIAGEQYNAAASTLENAMLEEPINTEKNIRALLAALLVGVGGLPSLFGHPDIGVTAAMALTYLDRRLLGPSLEKRERGVKRERQLVSELTVHLVTFPLVACAHAKMLKSTLMKNRGAR